MWPVYVCLQNLAEAEYVVALFMYMRLLGYPAERISILTTYNGQKHLIRDVINQRCAGNSFFGQPSKVRAADTMISCFIFRSERLTLRSTMLMCVPVHGRVNCINVCEQLVLYSKWVFIFFCPAFTVLPLLQQWTGLMELVVEGDWQTDSLKRVKVLLAANSLSELYNNANWSRGGFCQPFH